MTHDGTSTPPDDRVLLRLEGVGKVYRMGEVDVPVLHGVDLAINRGELTVIVGPSGSGKTTLLNLIGGMDNPTDGAIWFGESNLAAMSARELTQFRREHVGYIFQLYNLVPTLTAEENVAIATEIVEGAIDPETALEQVGLKDRLDHFPSQLSGGEQQRVAIARALAKNPIMLLCDEPTGALDLEKGRQVLDVLVRLAREQNRTVLLITHNAPIASLADRVIRIGSGRIESDERNEQPAAVESVQW